MKTATTIMIPKIIRIIYSVVKLFFDELCCSEISEEAGI